MAVPSPILFAFTPKAPLARGQANQQLPGDRLVIGLQFQTPVSGFLVRFEGAEPFGWLTLGIAHGTVWTPGTGFRIPVGRTVCVDSTGELSIFGNPFPFGRVEIQSAIWGLVPGQDAGAGDRVSVIALP